MRTLQQELSKTTLPTQRTADTKPTPKTAPTSRGTGGRNILKKLREDRARLQDAEHNEEQTEEVAALQEADAILTMELNELRRQKGHPKGSAQAQQTLKEIEEKTDLQAEVQSNLTAILKSDPKAHAEGTQRYNFRQEGLNTADSIRLVIGDATAKDVKGLINGALEAGLVVTTDQDKAVFSFDHNHYRSVWPGDASVSDVAISLKELIEDLRNRNSANDKEVEAELRRGGFFISTRREPDSSRPGKFLDSELDLFREEEKPCREASEFLSRNGRYVVRVGRGYTILEQREGRFFAIKTSDIRTGRALFTVPDRETGARVARRSAPEINNSGTTLSATDVSGVWYDPLREALEADLRRGEESNKRREKADELRDISQIGNSITFFELSEGGVGTVPVSISYEDPENGRRHTVTFQMEGNGNSFRVNEGTVPGTEGVIKRVKRGRGRDSKKIVSSKAFLPDFIGKDTSLGVLTQDPVWKLVQALNKPFETSWQLNREAGQRKAVPVSTENIDGLISVENGQDGLYAVPATIQDKVVTGGESRKVYKPVGYIVERKGSKVEIVWAVPGTSTAFASELRGEHEVASLPFRMKVILGSAEWKLLRRNSEHLRLPKKSNSEKE